MRRRPAGSPGRAPRLRLPGWTPLALAVALVAGPSAAGAQGTDPDSPTRGHPPRLVVVLVVDQMRHDILERFDDQFVGGFRRLLDESAYYTRARHLHGVPHTAPGHATLATGTHPSSHGIVANNWLDRGTGASVYAVADTAAHIPGDSAAPGRSPANMLRPALGSALRAARPGARVVAVAGKDRSAITMAGHDANGAYWFDRTRGRFVTSSYYAERQPPWLASPALVRMADSLAASPWPLLLPESEYARSREDSFPPEGPDGVFPHRAPATGSTGAWAPEFAWTPFLDELTLAVARSAVDAHDLGEDDVPDLLWIGLSAADFIGHTYGPYSREVQDHFLRLDRMLGELLDWLDERVGGDYVVALSSDHGVLPMPEELARRGYDAGRIDMDTVAAVLRAAVDSAAASEGLRQHVPTGLVVLDGYILLPPGLQDGTVRRIRERVARALRRIDDIADVITADDVARVPTSTEGTPPAGAGSGERPAEDGPPLLAGYYRRSYYPRRSPDFWIRPRDGWLLLDNPTVTAHITPYAYDVRVPLLLAGPGITPGRYGRAVATVDLAPTLARVLGVDPGDVDGAPLVEALGAQPRAGDEPGPP